ncbi:MAG: galactokinase [Chloroflexi bacterium]|nr:galactokinase [Chloroflexota bacterium]
MDTVRRKEMISAKFTAYFGAPPRFWSRAPGRVDLMGSHTDYNMGYVMTMTINRDTWIAARPRQDRHVRIRSLNIDGESEFSLDAIGHDQHVPWSNYVRGVALMLQHAGYELQGFDGLIHSTVPFGSGLSSSAAIEMATAVMFQQISGFELDPVTMALLGQKAENEFVGVSTGILDQYSSAMGQLDRAILLDCRHLRSKLVAIPDSLRVVICDTRAERQLVGSEYDERRQQCEMGVSLLQRYDPTIRALRDVSLSFFEAHERDLPDVVARRCRFIIEENQRVLDLAEALPRADTKRLSELFRASYLGARDLFEIGAPAMQAMVEAIESAPGVVGGRQAGAGFGGCLVALVHAGSETEFSAHVEQAYLTQTGTQPHIFTVTASAGAGTIPEENDVFE